MSLKKDLVKQQYFHNQYLSCKHPVDSVNIHHFRWRLTVGVNVSDSARCVLSLRARRTFTWLPLRVTDLHSSEPTLGPKHLKTPLPVPGLRFRDRRDVTQNIRFSVRRRVVPISEGIDEGETWELLWTLSRWWLSAWPQTPGGETSSDPVLELWPGPGAQIWSWIWVRDQCVSSPLAAAIWRTRADFIKISFKLMKQLFFLHLMFIYRFYDLIHSIFICTNSNLFVCINFKTVLSSKLLSSILMNVSSRNIAKALN